MDRKILNAILRTDFKSFVIKVFNEVSGGSVYLDNWHIDVICNELVDMHTGRNNRLIINIPPRYMKSIICSVAFPAWLLGKNPKTNIICISYNDALAEDFATKCRDIIMSNWYQEIFPMTKLHPARRALNKFSTTRGGGHISTSVECTLTGRGADWIIIDDPQKPNDALSDNQRDKVNNWYSSTLYSRLNDKSTGKILLSMQRLHQNDLSGHLLETDPSFKLIKLPVIATETENWMIQKYNTVRTITRSQGELLHPERENFETVMQIKESLGEYAFTAQYQQDPTPAEGGIIKESWFKYYNDQAPDSSMRNPKHVFISWDTANKTGENNAYSVGCVILMSQDYKFYLIDVVRGKWDTPELFEKILFEYNKYKYTQHAGSYVKILIEDKASGEFLIPMLNKAHD